MSTTFTKDEIATKLADFPGWALGDDGQLRATFTFKSFAQAVLFVNAVAHLAESFDHHPDLLIHGYKNVAVSLMSHDVNGITDRDFRLIAAIRALPKGQPAQ